jgi:hypothetical protein
LRQAPGGFFTPRVVGKNLELFGKNADVTRGENRYGCHVQAEEKTLNLLFK